MVSALIHCLVGFLLGTMTPPLALSASQAINSVEFVIQEEQSLGTPVGDPAARARLRHMYPLDFPHFTYAILMNKNRPYFQLQSPSNSTLFIHRRIDREALCRQGVTTCCPKEGEYSCRIELEMNVNYKSITRHRLTVSVQVQDIDDNGCQFEGGGRQDVSFLENDPTGKELLRSPIDPDWDYSVQRNRIRFKAENDDFELVISPSFARNKFRVQLRLKKALDREAKAYYPLLVVADDGASEHECYLRVNVTVLDLNDNAPKFAREKYQRDVNETDSVPLDVLQVRATDIDAGNNSRVTYEIDAISSSEAAVRLFQVNEHRGVVTLRRPLRFDTRERTYQLLVLAKDMGRPTRRTGSTQVLINVLDINNNAPVIQVLNLRGGRRISIPEEQPPPIGVASIQVKDDDEGTNAEIRCSLRQNRRFALRDMSPPHGSFQVISNRMFDRETTPKQTFDLVCHDLGTPRLSADKTVYVHIDDINDHAPEFKQRVYSVKVNEDCDLKRVAVNYKINQVHATDEDDGRNAEIRYALAKVPRWSGQDLFSIDTNTGWIKSNGNLDRERQDTYNLTVLAVDRGQPRRFTGSAVVKVTVLDVNDHKPMFESINYNFYLRENVEINTLVNSLTVVDRDINDNGQLHFKVQTDTPQWQLPFRVVGVQARSQDHYRVSIYTSKHIDREQLVSSDRGHQTSVNPVYKFYVVATDFGSPYSHSSSAEVSIHITDMNDETPKFIHPHANNTRVSVSFRERVGKEVLRLDAIDRDAGNNGTLVYTLRHGNQMGYFTVDPTKGIVRIAKPLSASAVGHYTIEAVVSDRGSEPKHSRININISIDNSVPKTPQRSNRKLSTRAINLYIIIAIVASSFVVSLVLLGVICFIMQRNKRRRMREGEAFTKTDCSGLSTNLSERSVSNLVQRNEHAHLQNHRQPPPYQSVPVEDPRGTEEPPLAFTDGHAVEIVSKPKQERFAYTPLVSSFDSPSYRPRVHAEGNALPPPTCNGFALASKTTSIDRKRPGHRGVAGGAETDNTTCTFPRDLHRLTDTFI